jgi:hypothetical protein
VRVIWIWFVDYLLLHQLYKLYSLDQNAGMFINMEKECIMFMETAVPSLIFSFSLSRTERP